MAELFNKLPGVELPVHEVTQRLATMWEGDVDSESPSEFRAVQMNVILHFGFDVSVEDAQARFDTVIRFAQRYPARIIVLCPTREEDCGMSAKLFSQCYIGPSHREMCCCEALLLRFKPENHGYLANQVSIWLESDLPTYHWFSEVRAHRIEKYFASLVASARRCVYDSSIEEDGHENLTWPQSAVVHDLAASRLLPVRQSVGQFLSAYPIHQLCGGLSRVRIQHCDHMRGEAEQLAVWIRSCLCDCDGCQSCPLLDEVEFVVNAADCSETDDLLVMHWEYGDGRYLNWRKFKDGARGEIEADLGKGVERIPTNVKPLTPEQALAEALFF